MYEKINNECFDNKPIQYTTGHKRLLWMVVLVIYIPNNSICSIDAEEENKHHMIPRNDHTNLQLYRTVEMSFEQISLCTIVDHYSKLFQEKVDVCVIFHFSSFTEHDQDIPSAIQEVLQCLQLKSNGTTVWKHAYEKLRTEFKSSTCHLVITTIHGQQDL